VATFDDEEIDGKAYEPFGVTLHGDKTRAKGLIGYGQALLGNLKHRMQLGGLEQGRERKVLPDGSVIQFRSIKGPLADLDKIDIFVPQDAGVERAEGEERIVEFHAYCSAPLSGIDDYNADAYSDAAKTYWLLYSPYYTSGEWLVINTDADIGSPIAFAEGGFYSPFASNATFIDYYSNQHNPAYDYQSESAGTSEHYVIADDIHLYSVVDSYSMYLTLENTFRHVWDREHRNIVNKRRYIGRFTIDTLRHFDETARLSDYFYEMVNDPQKNEDYFGYLPSAGDTIDEVDTALHVTRAPKFLNGWYILYCGGVQIIRDDGSFLTPSDQYRATLIFKTNLGRNIVKEFTFDIDFDDRETYNSLIGPAPEGGERFRSIPAHKALAINFNIGKIRVYTFERQADNPFHMTINLNGLFNERGLDKDYAELCRGYITNEISIL
jgi:hypothetical protein